MRSYSQIINLTLWIGFAFRLQFNYSALGIGQPDPGLLIVKLDSGLLNRCMTDLEEWI